MAVDSALLQKNKLNEEEEDEAGNEMRRRKKQGRKKTEKKNQGDKDDNGNIRAKKRGVRPKLLGKNKKEKAEEKGEKEDDTADSGFLTRPSKRLLRWSWISILITGGTSIVLSLGYLNFHAFFRRVLPRFFCKFGEEWKPPYYKGKDPFSKLSTKGLGVIEVLTIIFLDFLAVAIFVIVVATILTIVIIIYKLFNWFTGFFG